jgi:acylphosphatase
MSRVRNGTPRRLASCRPFRTESGTQWGHHWASTTVSRRGRAERLPTLMRFATLRSHLSRWVAQVPLARCRKELVRPVLRRAVASLVHWHCLAFGRVQGVNYRARVAEAAYRHGVVGAVANRADGTVFIDVQGGVEAVEAFLRDVSGPRGVSHARVVQRVAEMPVSLDLVGFEIRRD